MTHQRPDDRAGPGTALVWYVAYGSNALYERFLCYLRGGQPNPDGRVHNPGCRDVTPPRSDAPCAVPHALYFAGPSRTWGGGVAFLDPRPDPAQRTLARRYLVTAEQFADVVAQESALHRGPLRLPETVTDAFAVGDGKYDLVLPVGDVEGVPMLTCTSPRPRRDAAEEPPAPRYLDAVARGLVEAGHTPRDVAAHLGRALTVCPDPYGADRR